MADNSGERSDDCGRSTSSDANSSEAGSTECARRGRGTRCGGTVVCDLAFIEEVWAMTATLDKKQKVSRILVKWNKPKHHWTK